MPGDKSPLFQVRFIIAPGARSSFAGARQLLVYLTRLSPASTIFTVGGYSSAGRAPASQAEGHGFESRYPLMNGKSTEMWTFRLCGALTQGFWAI